MKTFILTLLLTLSFTTSAHVGGHHKENIFTPKFGGTLAKVESPYSIAEIAELANDEKKGLFLFLYDRQMNLVTKTASKASVTGEIISGRGKRKKVYKVAFNFSEDRFKVKLPQIKKRPFTLKINVKQGDNTSSVTFKNVD